MNVDVFSIAPNDQRALNKLIDLLVTHCETEEVERFLEAFADWHRIQHRRVPQREYEAARHALQAWQDRINDLPGVTP